MSDAIRIEVHDSEVQAALAQLGQQLEDLSPAMRAISEALQFETSQNFAAEGRPDWQGLANSTIKARQRTGHWPGKKLQVSGRLASSITSSYSPVMAIIGSNVRYAAIQQFGGTVEHAARSQQLYFKHDAKTGEVGNRFVAKSKANFAQWATIGAHSSTMPARPFLPIMADGSLQPEAYSAVMEALRQNMGLP